MQALLEVGGANPLQPDGEGNSPLHYAVNLGRTESIKQILASELSLSASTAAVGSSLVQPNAAGLLPLHLAAIQGNALLCNFLSSMLPAAEPEEEAGQGAAMSHPGSRANSGRVAAYPEETGDAPRIIMNVHLDAVDASGHTPLHLAAAEGHLASPNHAFREPLTVPKRTPRPGTIPEISVALPRASHQLLHLTC